MRLMVNINFPVTTHTGPICVVVIFFVKLKDHLNPFQNNVAVTKDALNVINIFEYIKPITSIKYHSLNITNK